MPDTHYHILSTRPLDKSLIEEAEKQGITIDQADFIATKPIHKQEITESIQSVARNKTTVVFTSMNAVDAVYAQLREALPAWDIFSIGYTTQQLIRKYFSKSEIVATADDAGQLAREIIAKGDIREVTFFCGDRRRDELPDLLKSNGILVNEIIVYQTLMIPAITSAVYDAILFFSPSAVESFFTCNTLPAYTIPFAIGKTTAESIRQYTTNKIITGNAPGKNSLVNEALFYFKNKNTK